MLIELSVRNLAIFSDVRVPFAPGLNIVTGETGAGKSILVEAIHLALGERADPMAVKAGEAEAEVSARFDLTGRTDLKEAWEEAGFPWEEELVLRRVIPAAVIDRPKGYFPVPALKYLEGEYLDFVRGILSTPAARGRELFQRDYVEELLSAPKEHITPLRGSKLWQVALLEYWLQEHGI